MLTKPSNCRSATSRATPQDEAYVSNYAVVHEQAQANWRRQRTPDSHRQAGHSSHTGLQRFVFGGQQLTRTSTTRTQHSVPASTDILPIDFVSKLTTSTVHYTSNDHDRSSTTATATNICTSTVHRLHTSTAISTDYRHQRGAASQKIHTRTTTSLPTTSRRSNSSTTSTKRTSRLHQLPSGG